MRKVKKKDTFQVVSWVLAAILLVITLGLVIALVKLNMLPNKLLITISAIFVLAAVIVCILQIWFTHKTYSRVIVTILMVITMAIYSSGAVYLFQASGLITRFTTQDETTTTKVDVVAMNSSPLTDKASLNGATVGILETISRPSTDYMLSYLESEGITVNTKPYTSIQALGDALYGGEVNAIVLSQSYRENLADLEDGKFQNFDTETKIIYTINYVSKKETATANAVDDITTTPFNVLLSGIDSRAGFDTTSRSDVNMIATVNPVTKTVLLTSIPRDYYVTTACDEGYGCQNGALDKLTHTGLHGVETTKKTIENLLGIEINYTAMVNFNSVVSLVDALGGIEVNVEPGLAVDYFHTNDYFGTSYGVHEGINELNGQAALCYARERYAYADGDRQRVKNQQEVLMAIVKKATSPALITSFPSLVNAMQDAFRTDMTQEDIQKLVQFQLNGNPQWTFITYVLDGTGSTEFCAELGNNAYVMIPNQETVQTAKERIEAVMKGEDAAQVEAIQASGAAASETPAEDTTAAQEQPAEEQTVQEEPVYTEPAYTEPAYTEPAYTEPAYTDPTYTDPAYSQPAVDQYGYYDEYGNYYVY